MSFTETSPIRSRTDIFKSLPMPGNFEFTPEILARIKAGWQGNPALQGDKSEWKLPPLDDKAAILDFLGLSVDGIRLVLDAYEKEYAEDPEQLAVWKIYDNGHCAWTFPLLRRLSNIYTGRDEGAYDYDETYEGYMMKAVQQGLKPEFAIRVGLHPDAPGYTESRAEFWMRNIPQHYCDTTISNSEAELAMAWNTKMEPPSSRSS